MKQRTLAVIAVAIGALAWAFGSHLQAAIESLKVASASDSFASDFRLAHAEAVHRGSRIVLCKSGDGVYCSEAGSWAQGWLVFHDTNANSHRERDEPVIVREQTLSSSLRIGGTLDAVRSVAFNPGGAAQLVGAGLQTAVMVVCRRSAQLGEARQITLLTGPRPQVRSAVVRGCA